MNKIMIRVSEPNKQRLLKYLIEKSIYYTYIKNNQNKHYLIVYLEDYKKIKKRFKIKIINYYGIEGLKKFVKTNYIFLLSFIWGIILLYILSTTIFEVNINTQNNELKQKLEKELDSYDIKKYGRIKSYKKISNIKSSIINNNTELIEWLEIKRDGTKYEVLLTERIIIKKEIVNNTPRHIVASKDGLIKHLTSSKGEVIKEVNDYVKKGDIIISGNIHKNDKIINTLRAEGNVFAEVWYSVKTTIPYKYIEYVRTGKVINHYYIEIFNNKMTLLGYFKTNKAMNTKKTLIDKPYLGLKIVKEKKELYEYKEFNVSQEEALKEANNRSDKSIKNKLNENEYIIDKKVLNIYPKTGKIEVEIFYKVYENITDTLLIEKVIKGSE